MTQDKVDRSLVLAPAIVVGAGFLLLSAQLFCSLAWRMEHDTPLLHYIAYLIDECGFVPYRDVFETSMPGAFLFHLLIGKTLGYGDFAFRVVDFLYVVMLTGVSWRLMRRCGRLVAGAGSVLFGLFYLGAGPSMSLQRDCLAILPIATAVLAAGGGLRIRSRTARMAAIGALFGVAAAIKPQLGIGLPAVIWYASPPLESGAGRRLLHGSCAAACGFAVVFAVPLVWLWSTGGMPAFVEMFSLYLPLHLALDKEHDVVVGAARLKYLLVSLFEFGGLRRLLPAAVIGVVFSLAHPIAEHEKRLVRLLVAMACLYALSTAFAGQFWNYHWMPFTYFVCLLFALVLRPVVGFPRMTGSRLTAVSAVAVFLLLVVSAVRPAPDFNRQIRGEAPRPPKYGRVDAIADFLETNLRPGDTVQTRDWAGGALHAMLIAKAKPATPYIYDYHFLHHVSDPFIQKLRERFIVALVADPPRYFIEITDRPFPTGEDTEPEFHELCKILEKGYLCVESGDGYRICERIDLSTS